MSTTRRAKKAVRRRETGIPLADLAPRLDAIFAPGVSPAGVPNSGWIAMSANSEGRKAIERIFPTWAFQWRPGEPHWDGWLATVKHLPSLAAACPNSLPPDLVRLKPLQDATDDALSFLMASAAKDQGVRVAWLRFAADGQPTINFLEGKFRRTPNVLNLPTLRPLELSEPLDAFLFEMLLKAEANLSRFQGPAETLVKLEEKCELILAIWRDLAQPHGFGYMAIKGESHLEKDFPLAVSAGALFANSREDAVEFKKAIT